MTSKKRRVNKKLNYILAYFAVAFSGIHFFSGQSYTKIAFTIILGIIFFFKNKKIKKPVFFLIILFTSILFMQSIAFGGVSLRNYISFTMYYILTPYFIYVIIGQDAFKYIVNIMVVYSVISLIFWVMTNLSSSFHSYLSTIPKKFGTDPIPFVDEQFIIYSYDPFNKLLGFVRNPGPFNEPGSFGLFLIFAIILNTMRTKGVMDRKNKILIITSLTTFSTATYLSLFVLAGYFVLNKRIHPSIKLVYVSFFIIFIIVFFFKSDFMGNKIEKEFVSQTSVSLDTPTGGRFLGARKSIYVLTKYPLHGRGLSGSSIVTDLTSYEASAYGIFGFAAKLGLIGIIIYLYIQWQGLKYLNFKHKNHKKFLNYAYSALMLSMFAQSFLITPVFMMLIFSSLIYKKALR